MKIVKNPDGSMQRAAMTASALAKERRELKEQQQRTLLEAIPKDLSRHGPLSLPHGEHTGDSIGFELPVLGMINSQIVCRREDCWRSNVLATLFGTWKPHCT